MPTWIKFVTHPLTIISASILVGIICILLRITPVLALLAPAIIAICNPVLSYTSLRWPKWIKPVAFWAIEGFSVSLFVVNLFFPLIVPHLSSSHTQLNTLAPSPTPPYSCSDSFPNNSLHWPFDAVWHKNGNYLSSTPTDTGFHQIIVPCFPDTTDYVFEVQAKIENYNHAKEEFGMVIHWDESTGGGYQAGIAPPGRFVRLAGLNNPPYYPFPNPGGDLITYKLQVKNKVVTFFMTDGNTTTAYSSAQGTSANNFPSPGQVVLWIRGGTHMDIIST